MAKVSFSKLGLTKNQEVKILNWNEQNIEVRQYLPISEKLELISNVINFAHDGNANFANPVQVEVFTGLELLYAYTNISFTDKQKEDPAKLFDLVKSSRLLDSVVMMIPANEYTDLVTGVQNSITAIYAYQNSVMGVLDNISTDYSNLNLDATEIQKALSDPNNMALLKNVLTKLG